MLFCFSLFPILIYILFFIHIFYFYFLNLIDFVVVVVVFFFFFFFFLCSNIPSKIFKERDKTTPIAINILICFMGLMFQLISIFFFFFLVCLYDLLLCFNVLKLKLIKSLMF
jgi:hypothetical protein